MRILVFSNGSWDDTNATGNTLSNLFGGNCWKNDIFYNIYMRNATPNNKICNNYYRITLLSIIRNHFCKEKIGIEFNNSFADNGKTDYKNNNKERKIIDFIHNYSLNFIYTFADWFYRKKRWINKRFEKYIKEMNPDIFYAHINNFAFLNPLVKYVKSNTKAKIVILLTDNLYEDINNKSFSRRKKLRKDYREIIESADMIYAITDELKNEYGKIFNKEIQILRKGCSFDYPIRTQKNEVIRFVYAGNLLYGRDEVLSKIAKAIEYNNSNNSKKAFLEIYTGDTVSTKLKNTLNIENCSQIIGKREYNEIMKIENASDYVLHVESFEKKQIEYVKYSFSTKIIDCIQSGSCFIGVGPSDISSIKYIKKIPGAHVINSLDDIVENIINLINNDRIIQDSMKIREFAVMNHDIFENQNKLRRSFINIIKE